MHETTLLRLEGITKTFPGVKALSDVEFTLRRGEIHALMGENGAGKSTLIKIITGICSKEKGSIYINDKPVKIRSSRDALNAGISTVYQEIPLCHNLSVAENLFSGREKGLFINWKKMNQKADKILRSLNIPASPEQQLSSCSIAVQQMIAIARAVDQNCQVLILDEPTSSLDEAETAHLFSLMRELRSRGTGIIFVTHFLDQVFEICDRITVLRDGKYIGEYTTNEISKVQLVSEMVGKDLNEDEILETGSVADPSDDNTISFIEASDIKGSNGVKQLNFTLGKSRINGLAGLLGSGRSESARLIFGADSITGGEIRINGKKVRIRKPLDAMKLKIGYIPEDRKNEGLFPDLSVAENIVMALEVLNGPFKKMSHREIREAAEKYIKLLEIRTPSPDTPVRQLSGGNQQKVILARWLITNPDYLILDEPTRGIDVNTKMEIQKIVLGLAEEGKSITFISSELNEMLRVCSELTVLKDKKTVCHLSGNDLTQKKILSSIAQGVTENDKTQ